VDFLTPIPRSTAKRLSVDIDRPQG